MAIKFLVNKAELSGRLARWVLLLEEFNYTMEYKPGRMHLQVDHLSRLSKEVGSSSIDDRFRDDNLLVVIAQTEWYSDFVEFLTTQQLVRDWTKEDRKKMRINIKHYGVIWHKLFRKGLDRLLRYCVSEMKVFFIFAACHDSACGGHFSGLLTGQNILRTGYFWPTLELC